MNNISSLKQMLISAATSNHNQSDKNTTHISGSPAAYPIRISIFGMLSTGVLIASCINPQVTLGVHFLLLALAFTGIRQALMALFMICLIKFFNPALLKYSSECGLLFWLVLLSASARIILIDLKSAVTHWTSIIAFSLLALFTSLFTSRLPLISVIKSIVFMLTALSCMLGMKNLAEPEQQRFTNWMLSFIGTLVLASIPFYWVPAIGFWKNGRGFQGLLNHPQVFGVFLAPVMAFMLASMMKTELKKLYFSVPAVLLVTPFMIFSQARTGLLSVVMALITVLIINLSSTIRARIKVAVARSGAVALLLLFMVPIIIQFVPGAGATLKNYIYKNRGDEIGEAFERSRGAGVEQHFSNFLESPLVGNGFGVFAKPDPREEVQTAMGIPISSSTEKGIVLMAVLEETGLAGFVLFCWLITQMSKAAIRGGDPRYIAAFFSCLFVNFGEAVFFAPGGIGLYFWVFMGICVGLDPSVRNSSQTNHNGTQHENRRILANIL